MKRLKEYNEFISEVYTDDQINFLLSKGYENSGYDWKKYYEIATVYIDYQFEDYLTIRISYPSSSDKSVQRAMILYKELQEILSEITTFKKLNSNIVIK